MLYIGRLSIFTNRYISSTVKKNPCTPPLIAWESVCFLRSTLDHIKIGYSMANNAPIGPKSNINAATGPDNPVVCTLIFHFVVKRKTTPVFIE